MFRLEPSRASHPEWVVVDDPEHRHVEGQLIPSATNTQLMARGGCSLPIEAQQHRRGGVNGYMRRGLGSGLYFAEQPKLLSIFTLFGRRGPGILHWRARLVPTDELRSRVMQGQAFDGSIRLIADSSQGGHVAMVATSTAGVQGRQLGALDDRGGWTVGSEVPVQFAIEGFYGLALYGVLAGVRVTWGAVSVTER